MDGRRLLSVGLVAGLLVATALASLLVLGTEQSDDRQAARGVADQAAAAVASTLRLASLSVRGADGFVTADGDLPPKRFAPFAEDALEERTLTVLGWARWLPADRRAAFERDLGRPIVAPAPDGVLRRQGDAAEYLPIARIRPATRESLRVADAALRYQTAGQKERRCIGRRSWEGLRPDGISDVRRIQR
ncbi:MAG: CHASE domain-containing protein, partial [Baekduiaceae bacterium]